MLSLALGLRVWVVGICSPRVLATVCFVLLGLCRGYMTPFGDTNFQVRAETWASLAEHHYTQPLAVAFGSSRLCASLGVA